MSASSHSHAGSRELPGNCTLERALETVVNIFHQYSIRQVHQDRLNAGEFRTLLREQTPSFLSTCNRNRADYLEKLFQETDLDKNKELSFEEFTTVLSKLADDAHRISHGSERCGPDRD